MEGKNRDERFRGRKIGQKMGRWGHLYEIAELIGFLVSPGAGFVSGVDILADGDQTAITFVEQL